MYTIELTKEEMKDVFLALQEARDKALHDHDVYGYKHMFKRAEAINGVQNKILTAMQVN